jgi:hypothetical protein
MTRITRFTALLALSGAILSTAASASAAARPAAGPSLGPLFAAVPAVQDVHGRQARHTFVGAVAGSEAYVALVAAGGQALVYICDGDRVAAWLPAKVAGKRVALASHGVVLRAHWAGHNVTGTVRLGGGAAHRFTAAPAVEGKTGLFRGSETIAGRQFRLGWIWLGSRLGLRGADTSGGSVKRTLAVDLGNSGGSDNSGGGSGGSGGSGGTGGGDQNQARAVDCAGLQQDYQNQQGLIDRIDALRSKSKAVKAMRADAFAQQFDDIAAFNGGGCPGTINGS